MPRRISTPDPGLTAEADLTRRHRLAQRTLLESVSLDSPLYERHLARLAKAGDDPAERLACYEGTLREAEL